MHCVYIKLAQTNTDNFTLFYLPGHFACRSIYIYTCKDFVCTQVISHAFNYLEPGGPVIVGLEQTKVTVSEGFTSQCCVVIINGTTTKSYSNIIQLAMHASRAYFKASSTIFVVCFCFV